MIKVDTPTPPSICVPHAVYAPRHFNEGASATLGALNFYQPNHQAAGDKLCELLGLIKSSTLWGLALSTYKAFIEWNSGILNSRKV